MKPLLIRTLLIVSLVLICPFSGYGEPPSLFYTADPTPQIAMPAAHPLRVARQAITAVDLGALQAGNALKIQLQLFDDTSLTAEHFITEKRSANGFAWYGRVKDIKGSTIVLVAHQDQLAGVIRLPLKTFKIQPLKEGLHVIREIHAAAATVAPLDATPVSAEHEVFRLTNEERAEAGLHALTWDDALFQSARGHSLDMATNNYFEHDGQDGRDPSQRMLDAGYAFIPYGENIAYGYPTPEAVVAGWMGSTGHRNNILNASACDLGVGLATHDNTHGRSYWTQNFGRFDWIQPCPAPTANQQPVAQFTGSPLNGEPPLQVHLDGSGSYDPDGEISGYQWDFGDGTSANGATVQHTYAAAGQYTVRLTVVDNDDELDTHTEVDFIAVGDSMGSDPGDDPGSTSGSVGGSSGGCFIRATGDK